ncbi:MAG TPA: GDSL-type esterase/lipase family protein, partial [Chitinophagaceae bacterium]|nr:GDSL-type esterase/lipase family protein [Chitinophagaceae bacterium]
MASFIVSTAKQLLPVYLSTPIDNGNVRGYYETLPANYSTGSGTYPLIIFMHGMGQLGTGDSTDLPLVWNYTYSLPSYIHDGLFNNNFTVKGSNYSFIILMPQFKNWTGGTDVENMINYAKANFRVDPTRIYVVGFSMGGGASWFYASTSAYKHQTAAMVSIAGALAPTVSMANVIASANLPVWAFHDSLDNVVPLSWSQGWVNDINTYVPAPNPLARLTIFDSTGHEGWTKACNPAYTVNNQNIYQWLLSYTNSGYSGINQTPVALANSDTLTLPTNTVSLDGTGSYDNGGTITGYLWTKISGPSGFTLSDNTSPKPILGNLIQGTYQFALTVTDNTGATGSDTAVVVVNPETSQIGCKNSYKIVIMGSSTAYGDGATPLDSGWAYKFTDYLQGINSAYSVTNLALPGYTTYQETPTDDIPPSGMPLPDTSRNITKALSLKPDAIIINLPSNDAANSYPLADQQANFNAIEAAADSANVPVWITTTQPRDFLSSSQMSLLTGMRDWIYTRFTNKAIDFWDTIANPDGTIRAAYYVDGIHVNNAGHQIFFERVVAKDIPDSLCLRSAGTPPSPVANAGKDTTIYLPASSTILSGAASSDPGGTIAGYSWHQVSGPSASILSNTYNATITVSGLVKGTYKYELTVTGSLGLTANANVSVTVASPGTILAVTAASTTLVLPTDSTVLDGSGSVDSGGVITSFLWAYSSGPAAYTLSNPDSAKALLSNLVAGTYTFNLTVKGSTGGSATDSEQIIVNAQPDTSVTDRVLIDVGPTSAYGGAVTPSPDWQGKYWNNMTNATEGIQLSNAVDVSNNKTGLSLVVLKRMDAPYGTYGPGMNTNGPRQVIGDYPVTAVQDNAYADMSITGGGSWELEGLDTSKTYQVKFWGSRITTDTYRILEIKKSTDTVWQQY